MKRLLLLIGVFLPACLMGQTLEAVLSSIQERHELAERSSLIDVELSGGPPPAEDPELIEWDNGADAYPAESSLNAITMAQRVALLNRAVAEYEKIAPSYLNVRSPEENVEIATMEPYSGVASNFRLPRATVENYHGLLLELALRVDDLKVIPWLASYTILAPDAIEIDGPAPTVVSFPNSGSEFEHVGYSFREYVTPEGAYNPGGGVNGNGGVWPYNVRMVSKMKSILGSGNTIGGKLFAFYRPEYSPATTVTVRSENVGSIKRWKKVAELEPNQEHAVGTECSIGGGWAYIGGSSEQRFIPSGFQVLNGTSGSVSWLFGNDFNPGPEGLPYDFCAYNGKFRVVLQANFTKGLSAPAVQSSLALVRRAQNEGSGCGMVVDAGSGVISLAVAGIGEFPLNFPKWYSSSASYNYESLIPTAESMPYAYSHSHDPGEDAIKTGEWLSPLFRGPGFRSGGNARDVRYETGFDEEKRAPMLEWSGAPYTPANGWSDYRNYYAFWQAPRLRQVVGQDIVVDIDYERDFGPSDLNDYRTVVKVFRVPTGHEFQDDEDGFVDTSTLVLWKQYKFVDDGSSSAGYPQDPLKVKIEELNGKRWEITWTGTHPADATEEIPRITGWTVTTKDQAGEAILESLACTLAVGGNEKLTVSAVEKIDGKNLPAKTWLLASYASYGKPGGKIETYSENGGENDLREWTMSYPDPEEVSYGAHLPSIVEFEGSKEPAGQTQWNSDGTVAKTSEGDWENLYTYSGSRQTVSRRFKSRTYQTTRVEWKEGAMKIRNSSTPDGSTGITGNGAMWVERTLWSGTGASTGQYPFQVKKVENCDGTFTNYHYEIDAGGALTIGSEDKPSGYLRTMAYDGRGYPLSEEIRLKLGDEIQVGGMEWEDPALWGAPQKSVSFVGGVIETWEYDENHIDRVKKYTDGLGMVSTSSLDDLERPKETERNGITTTFKHNEESLGVKATFSDPGLEYESKWDAFGRGTSGSSKVGSESSWSATHEKSGVDVSTENDLTGANTSYKTRQADGSLESASGDDMAFGGTKGDAISIEGGLFKSRERIAEQSSTFATVWTDAWGRVHKREAPSASGGKEVTEWKYSKPADSVKRVEVSHPSGMRFIEEKENRASAWIQRSGMDVNRSGALGGADRYTEAVTDVSNDKVRTRTTLHGDTSSRELKKVEVIPETAVTSTTLNGNEETLDSTPDFTAKTLSVHSSRGWTRNSGYNSSGQLTGMTASGAGIPSMALTPTWRADGTLDALSSEVGSQQISASYQQNGLLSGFAISGRGNAFGGHEFVNGQEQLGIDGVTYKRDLDGTGYSVTGAGRYSESRSLRLSGGGYAEGIVPAVGASTVRRYNAAGAQVLLDYAAGSDVAYAWLDGGLLNAVSRARGGNVVMGYTLNGARDLNSVTYPSASSGEAFSYPAMSESYGVDGLGRPTTISDSSGTRNLAFAQGRLLSSSYASGPLSGYRVVDTRDIGGRRNGFEVWHGGTMIHGANFGLTLQSGEIESVQGSGFSVGIGRDGDRNVTGLQWQTGTASITQSWNRGVNGRVMTATSSVSGAPGFSYSYDTRGKRTSASTTGRGPDYVDPSGWAYEYDGPGQLTSAVHPMLGSYTYAFDGIGRRTSYSVGGVTYPSANGGDALNRFLQMDHPRTKRVDVETAVGGKAWFGSSDLATVDGVASFTLSAPGDAGGWKSWKALGKLPGAGEPGANPDAWAELAGSIWFPPKSESFVYDADGNRQSSARWDYGWDGRNFLRNARTKDYSTALEGWDLSFDYDSDGRRYKKTVKHYRQGVLVEERTVLFVWDGWDLVYERHEDPAGALLLERKYVWGPDLGGRPGSVGGAGGLLLIREVKGVTTQDFYPTYDGTGHVVGLADSAGTLVADYAWGPFGEPIYAHGVPAESNPFRWATKYYDTETGLYYFGYRYYDPATGTWLSREPLGEDASLNLYAYCHNDPANKVDRLGLDEVTVSDGNAFYNFVQEVNGPRGGWLKKLSDHVFLAKFDASERKFVQSVPLGRVEGDYVIFANGKMAKISDLNNLADKRSLGFAKPSERLMLLNQDLAIWSARAEGSAADGIAGTADKVADGLLGLIPFMPADRMTLLEATREHFNWSPVNLDSRSFVRGTVNGDQIDSVVQVGLFVLPMAQEAKALSGFELLSSTTRARMPFALRTGAFNPASRATGEGLGVLMGREVRVSQKGLDLVESHLAQFGSHAPNTQMIERLRSALRSGQKISGADASFYLHEAAEATMMNRGVLYDAAHDAALGRYRVSPFSVYHPEVIQANPGYFNSNWNTFWEIK